MSITSMTGYGHGAARDASCRVHVELSSVNRKQLDIQVHLADELAPFEARIVEEISAVVQRGRVSGRIVLDLLGARRAKLVVDEALAQACVHRLRHAAANLGLRTDWGVELLFQLPGVVRFIPQAADPEPLWLLVQAALRQALRRLLGMRRAEGRALKTDLAGRIKGMGAMLAIIARRRPQITANYRRLLHERLSRLGVETGQADERLLREVALFAEKSDISEEITRLQSHLKQGRRMLGGDEPAGRALDFLAQEMLREINTIGSKANDGPVAQQAVNFKAELERFREQIQNIE